MTPRSLLICILVALSASTKVTAAGLRGSGEESKEEALTNGDEKLKPQKEQQSRRQLPPGQPNYGLTPSEHMRIYGWRDQAGYYGRYGWYDGGEYERGTYGNPWGDAQYYARRENGRGQGWQGQQGQVQGHGCRGQGCRGQGQGMGAGQGQGQQGQVQGHGCRGQGCGGQGQGMGAGQGIGAGQGQGVVHATDDGTTDDSTDDWWSTDDSTDDWWSTDDSTDDWWGTDDSTDDWGTDDWYTWRQPNRRPNWQTGNAWNNNNNNNWGGYYYQVPGRHGGYTYQWRAPNQNGWYWYNGWQNQGWYQRHNNGN